MHDEFLWTERFRPKTISETILPNALKKQLEGFVREKELPNLILTGNAGVGKTTAARAILEEIGADYLVINGSLDAGVDVLRNEIRDFATTASFTGERKYIILDEADYLHKTSTQPALRNFMEEYSQNCGFILTCNFHNKIIQPLHSRCTVIDFSIPKAEMASMARQFFDRIKKILESEGVEFDGQVLAEFIMRHIPDWRRTINELQGYSMRGPIDTGILAATSNEEFEKLVDYMKKGDFLSIRKWVALTDMDFPKIARKLYDTLENHVEKRYIPWIVVVIADYGYKNAFVVDKDINTAAMFAQIMREAEFK